MVAVVDVVEPARMGRPYIGPKVQTNIPLEQALLIEEEAVTRGVPHAEVLREVIEAGLKARMRRQAQLANRRQA